MVVLYHLYGSVAPLSTTHGKEQVIKSAATYKSYDDSNIDDKEQVRDSGIMMSNTATFTLHILEI